MLDFKNISISFGEKPLLSNISGRFDPGQFIAIVGPNGVGKTTLIKSLAGLERPTSGDIQFFNQDIFSIPPKNLAKLRGYIPTDSICHWDMIVEDVIALGLIHHPTNRQDQVFAIMQDLGLTSFQGRTINSLSSGEKAITHLARVLIANPDYIFADEILGNLHITNQHKIMQHLQRLTEKGKTVVLITHNLLLSQDYCNVIFSLESNRLSFEPIK